MTDGDDMAREWADLSRDEQLLSIYAELRRIADALDATDAQAADATMYECKKCEATVAKDERQSHATEQHKAPVEMVAELFTEV